MTSNALPSSTSTPLAQDTPPPTQVAAGAICRLSPWGLIRAQGEDSAKFLHGQLTQDIVLQASHQARLAGYCSAKGRLLATMLALKPAQDEVLLALPRDVLAPTLKRLSMFVLRAKCKLSDASADWQLWGLAGQEAQQWLGDSAPAEVWSVGRHGEAIVVRLLDAHGLNRYLLLQTAEAPAPALSPMSEADWARLEVQAGLVWVTAATVEQFVPQMINLELLGGVNFQKGCYPGQEVVARSQYRGTLKRRTYLFSVEAEAAPGQEIFHSADPGQPAALVASVAWDGTRTWLLAETKIAALASGSLHLGSAEGPVLSQHALPYPITEPQ